MFKLLLCVKYNYGIFIKLILVSESFNTFKNLTVSNKKHLF